MKQLFTTTFICLAFISHLSAQSIKEMVIEPAPEENPSVFSNSCNTPDLGVVVFKTAISGLWFEMYPESKLINTKYNRQRNEYIMCVEPTDGKYRFTITHAEYESVDFIVENIKSSGKEPQFFKINPKENPVENRIENPNENSNSSNVDSRPASPVRIETPNRKMEMKLTNMEFFNNGKDFLLEFLLINRGQDISNYSFYGGHANAHGSAAYDNLGTQKTIDVAWNGKTASHWSSGASGPIPNNIPTKVQVGVYDIDPQATHLSQIRVKGDDGFFIFKDIPLRTSSEINAIKNSTNSNTASPVRIETPNRKMGVELTNMELIDNGKNFLIEFLLTNRGQDIDFYEFHSSSKGSVAYDNLGDKKSINVFWNGRSASYWVGTAQGPLPGNIPIKVQVAVFDINPRATHISQIKVKCSDGFFIFKDVPIQ